MNSLKYQQGSISYWKIGKLITIRALLSIEKMNTDFFGY